MVRITESDFYKYCQQFGYKLGCILQKEGYSQIVTESGEFFEDELIKDIYEFNLHSIDGISTNDGITKTIFDLLKVSFQRIINYNNGKNAEVRKFYTHGISEQDREKYRFEGRRFEMKIQTECALTYSIVENALKYLEVPDFKQKREQ